MNNFYTKFNLKNITKKSTFSEIWGKPAEDSRALKNYRKCFNILVLMNQF